MKRAQTPLLVLGTAIVVSTALSASSSRAEEQIACASDVPAARKGQGHWYYRIIDGRKCWYDGKPMMPKTSLYWSDNSTAKSEPTAAAPDEKEAASKQRIVKPSTDGRNVGAQSPASQSAIVEPATPPPAIAAPTMAQGTAWPAPAANEISFESRWLGLQSRN